MKATEPAYNIIMKWEQFRSKPYQDDAGVWTIGYGHTRTATMNMCPITKEEAIQLLKEDVRLVEKYIQHNYVLRQCQFDALTSLLFNIGFGDFAKTNTSKLIFENKDDKYIAGEWIEFRNSAGEYVRGLMRRRIDELSLYYSW